MGLRAEITALNKNLYKDQSLGWVTITHPFHPLQGRCLEVFCRKQEVFLLKDPSRQCKIAVPREWTDKSDPDPYQSLTYSCPTLSIPHLLQLVEFLGALNQTQPKKEKA